MVYFLCKAYDSDRQNCYFALSLPVRGAWIEMHYQAQGSSRPWSLPVRGAWIEMICYVGILPCCPMSLPVRGAWIEILVKLNGEYQVGRSPCGERGLKCVDCVSGIGSITSLPVRGAWIEITW